MDRLWSPWRSRYIQSFGTDQEATGCVFCAALASDRDDERYVVRRHEHCIAMLNLYPYNSGHLLLIPKLHVASYHDLPLDAYRELTDLVRQWLRVFDAVMHPQGYNIGSNIGRVGGAGIDQHIHMHIVPRWNGDANFMPVVADTKVISESLDDTMHRLRQGFDALPPLESSTH
ncbi:MAG TPA: HIT domain-containing protein [Bacteroidota bacterium]|nr:HIT domain-containing protein [Bacteroidota bacterium]